jgi:hypothetical protein
MVIILGQICSHAIHFKRVAFCTVTHPIYTNKICKIRELIDVSEIDIVIVLYSIVNRQSFFEAKSILGKHKEQKSLLLQ